MKPYSNKTQNARDLKKAEKLGINRFLLAGNDTVVRCPKCGRTQALTFENGLENGWSTCCGGLTMPIVYIRGKNTVEKAIANIMAKAEVTERKQHCSHSHGNYSDKTEEPVT
jgi:hypothetical protein